MKVKFIKTLSLVTAALFVLCGCKPLKFDSAAKEALPAENPPAEISEAQLPENPPAPEAEKTQAFEPEMPEIEKQPAAENAHTPQTVYTPSSESGPQTSESGPQTSADEPQTSSDTQTEVAAQFEFTPIDTSYCSVSCLNKEDVTYADIPDYAEIDGKTYRVREVAESGFEYCLKLKMVSIGENVAKINDNAFRHCGELERVDIPSGFDANLSIGVAAFSFDCKLSKMDLSAVKAIGDLAFSGCENLESVSMPQVKSIGRGAFRDCPKLGEVAVYRSVETMGSKVFNDNNTWVKLVKGVNTEGWNEDWNGGNGISEVTENWTVPAELSFWLIKGTDICSVACSNKYEATAAVIPETAVIDGREYTVTKINDLGFRYCLNLDSVRLPSSIKEIGLSCFSDCGYLTDINLSEVESIDSNAFLRCSNLTEVDLSSVTQIGMSAFFNAGLISVDLPSVTDIGNAAFYYCVYLESVNIPQAISIGSSAFAGCTSLKEIIIPESVETVRIGIFNGNNTQVKAEAESKPEGWADDWNKGNENQNVIWNWNAGEAKYYFTKISDDECRVRIRNRTKAVEAIIPATAVIDGKEYKVTEIAADGFLSCRKLKKVSLPYTLKKIGNMAFGNCQNLEEIALANVEEIGNSAFVMCPVLADIVIPETCVKVGTYAFRYCNTKVYVRGTFDFVTENWNASWNVGNENQDVEYESKNYRPGVLI